MSEKRCKDCESSDQPPATARPAPYPGPRCATHHRRVTKARKSQARETYVARTYGLSAGAYRLLKEFQGGTCAICQRATGATRNLSIDHDHACCPGRESCGRCVRGLLCRPCNDLLGHARDDLAFFRRALAYLADPPYRRMSR